jgi:undecaprenyl-diphosphatase
MRALVLVAALLIGVAALGAVVTTRPATPLDAAGFALRGRGVGLAAFFTLLGRTPVLLGLTACAIVGALALRQSAVPVAYLAAVQLLGQGANALVKLGFRRGRQDDWLLVRERDFSYPSGHAMTAVVFFAGFSLLVRHEAIPQVVAIPLELALGACVVGIPWSRLALGAHYATDVIGGLAFGTAWLLASEVVAARIPAVGT